MSGLDRTSEWNTVENAFTRCGMRPIKKFAQCFGVLLGERCILFHRQFNYGLDILGCAARIGNKFPSRRLVAKATATHFRAPIVYVNLVGAQDELIFDGGSFAMDSRGKVIAQSVRFEEDLNVVDLGTKKPEGGKRELPEDPQEILRAALVE